jgi:hypothetical protein
MSDDWMCPGNLITDQHRPALGSIEASGIARCRCCNQPIRCGANGWTLIREEAK